MDPLDAETVALLRDTSPPGARWRAAKEEYLGRDAYDRPGRLRWGLPVCAASDCFVQFAPLEGRHRFCSSACQRRDRYRQRARGHRARLRVALRAVVADRSAA